MMTGAHGTGQRDQRRHSATVGRTPDRGDAHEPEEGHQPAAILAGTDQGANGSAEISVRDPRRDEQFVMPKQEDTRTIIVVYAVDITAETQRRQPQP